LPTVEDLRLATGQLVTEDWYNDLCDLLGQIAYEGVVNLYGYVAQDLVPYADLLINLGMSVKQFNKIYCAYGYFSGNIWIGGHPVLKDGDCITVGSLATQAKTDVTAAINSAYLTGYGASTVLGIQAIGGALVPVKLGSKWAQAATAMTDIFSPDLSVLNSGRVRFKICVSYQSYAYAKHRLTGESTDLYCLLNGGVSLPAGCTHEFDFTVLSGDKTNLKIDQSTTVTVIVYNIPNA
jgi:hypothetical protein